MVNLLEAGDFTTYKSMQRNDLDALDYIRKPLKMERLRQAVEAKHKINGERKGRRSFS